MGKLTTSIAVLVCSLILIPEPGQLQQKPSIWQQINLGSVCFYARGRIPGVVRYLGVEGKLLGAVKLIHREGHVRCTSNTAYNSYWGCYHHPSYINFPLNVVITDNDDNVIFPAEKFIRNSGLWYSLPFTDALHSKEIVFTDYAHPPYIPPGAVMKVWYGEDLRNSHSSDNGGRVCVDVYGHLQ